MRQAGARLVSPCSLASVPGSSSQACRRAGSPAGVGYIQGGSLEEMKVNGEIQGRHPGVRR